MLVVVDDHVLYLTTAAFATAVHASFCVKQRTWILNRQILHQPLNNIRTWEHNFQESINFRSRLLKGMLENVVETVRQQRPLCSAPTAPSRHLTLTIFRGGAIFYVAITLRALTAGIGYQLIWASFCSAPRGRWRLIRHHSLASSLSPLSCQRCRHIRPLQE